MDVREINRRVTDHVGAARHPDWYVNLVADPRVGVEVGDETYDAVAGTLEGAERDRVWAELVTRYPFFTDHQARTSRRIPLVALTRS